MKVYLAGGMHGNWRDTYKKFLDLDVFDPCEHGLDKFDQYTTWDLYAIERCDVLLAYMEADNPGGQGLMLEIGYAKALGHKIIMVLDEEFMMQDRYRYFMMGATCADVVVYDHEDGLKVLLSFAKLY